MSSNDEDEITSLFVNTQSILPFRVTLEELGHIQPPTPIQTDNSTSHGFITNTTKQHSTKCMNMLFYWLQDKQNNNDIDIYWRPKNINIGDYFTKHHPTYHHILMRPIVLNSSHMSLVGRVCF